MDQEALDLVKEAIQDLAVGECINFPNFNDASEVIADFNPNLFGDYVNPNNQLNHNAIKTQYEQKRINDGDLAAVNYLISTYSMETFGQNSISFNYSISLVNQLPQGEPAITVSGYNSSGNMVSCEIKIDNDLFSYDDFGFITRVIKHELLHVLQGQYYGQNGPSNAAREFDAYYSQIFRFKDLKQIQNVSILKQLAEYMDDNMDQMLQSEKTLRQDMIDRAKQTFPKICGDD